MKFRKQIIIVLAIVIVSVMYMCTSGVNLRYIVAELTYSQENSTDGKIIFSKKTGFYDEEFYLNIYAPTDEIYYTLDGSEPTKDSYKYEEPLLIYDATQNENTNSMRTDVSSKFLSEDNIYEVPNYLIDKCTILKAVYYDKYGNRSKVEEQVYFVG